MAAFTDAIRLVDAAEMAALCPVLDGRRAVARPARSDRPQARRRRSCSRPSPARSARRRRDPTRPPRRRDRAARRGLGRRTARSRRRSWSTPPAPGPTRSRRSPAWRRSASQPRRRTIIAVDPPAAPTSPAGRSCTASPAISTCCPRRAGCSSRRSTRSPTIPATPSPRITTSPSPPTGSNIIRRCRSTRIAHRWAGLRTFTADRSPTAGFAPDAPGFFWLAGQGGYGLQTAPAMAEIAEALVTGARLAGRRASPPAQIRPERLTSPPKTC